LGVPADGKSAVHVQNQVAEMPNASTHSMFTFAP